jgi:hypothetical protein
LSDDAELVPQGQIIFDVPIIANVVRSIDAEKPRHRGSNRAGL